MVTVRTYWEGAEAALAKSLLDDYGILCALADENAHLYAPYAAPIRLVVEEDQVDRANHILSGHPEQAEETDELEDVGVQSDAPIDSQKKNPWELLAIAFYFFVPAVCILQIKSTHISGPERRIRYPIARIETLHLLCWLGIAFACVLIALYFYVRRSPTIAESPNAEILRE